MKKLLVVLLAMVMVFAFATAAYAFTDTDNLSTVQQDSIYRLSALGVLNGYPDGTFGPAKTITRAEFAKIACIVAGFGDVSSIMANTPSAFSDVAVGMWYTGYVNVAASQGYINGYPDGTFKPNKTISMAEVVTILLRIAGYDDNLPGPWPFDYIAKAGKLDVTDDVTFVSNVAANRADVAVMANNLLDVDMVNWNSDTSNFEDTTDPATTVLEDSFDAISGWVVFDNDYDTPDQLDGWYYSSFKNKEVSLALDDGTDVVMNEDCYFAKGATLIDLGGRQADIITNSDDEVIYIKLLGSVQYTDDIDGTIANDDLEINGDDVNVNEDFPEWYSSDFDNDGYDYAKVFYNDDDDVYAVENLADCMLFGDDAVGVVIADSWDADDETLNTFSATDGAVTDFKDEKYVVFKDGAVIDPSKIAANDVVDIFDAGNYYVLVVSALVKGDLTEAADNVLTVDGSDYYFAFDDNSCFNTSVSTDGVDGTYSDLTSITQLDDVYDTEIGMAFYPNPYALADVIANIASSDKVYGVVTDITVGGLFNKIKDVTILNQDGKEVTYDVDNGDNILTYNEDGAVSGTSDIELGSYVEVRLDADGVLDTVDEIILADDAVDYGDDMTVSGSKIQIDGNWYKINKDTLIFETVTKGYGDYDSADFDSANLLDNDDVLAADSVGADGIVIASNDGATLERLYLVDSDINSGNEGYSFVDKLYTNSTGDFVKMMDGTVAERDDDAYEYDYDTFYAYSTSDGTLETTPIFATSDGSGHAADASPFDDAYWVLGNGTSGYDYPGMYTLGDFIVEVDDVSSDTLTLDGDYYSITSDTVFYTIDGSGVADTADKGDVEEGGYVGAITDDSGNLLYVFVLTSLT